MDHNVLASAVNKLVGALGEDARRDGLKQTSHRVARAWREHWGSGYGKDPNEFLTCFEQQDYDEMVVVKNIPLYSHCEHHLAPIFGTATVAYIPNGRVVGLSKLSRLVDVFARRLQVQERLTVQIADALHGSPVVPRGVGVMLNCRHMCLESRGICKQGSTTITTALRGVMQHGEPRTEFLKVATS